MKKILLKASEIGEITATLTEDLTPISCKIFWDSLPIKVKLSTWGNELYGKIPVTIEAENPQEEFKIGDITYWLEGSGFCILYGTTPVSTNHNPKLISPGNYLAKIDNDCSIFKNFSSLELTI